MPSTENCRKTAQRGRGEPRQPRAAPNSGNCAAPNLALARRIGVVVVGRPPLRWRHGLATTAQLWQQRSALPCWLRRSQAICAAAARNPSRLSALRSSPAVDLRSPPATARWPSRGGSAALIPGRQRCARLSAAAWGTLYTLAGRTPIRAIPEPISFDEETPQNPCCIE